MLSFASAVGFGAGTRCDECGFSSVTNPDSAMARSVGGGFKCRIAPRTHVHHSVSVTA